MGVRILSDGDNAVLYCSTSGWAYGPLFSPSEHQDYSAEDMARRFCEWLPMDSRQYDQHDLENKYGEWLRLPPYFSLDDFKEGGRFEVPDCLKQKAYEQMGEDGIDPDYMCDREDEYIETILCDGPWQIKTEVSA